LQLTPQAPQFSASVWTLTHSLLQAVCRGEVQVKQAELAQIWLVPHACPQDPQFSGSEVRSTQSAPHSVWPMGQEAMQAPLSQNSPCSVSHWIPQPPQLLSSLR
jgi:hypothetical protein